MVKSAGIFWEIKCKSLTQLIEAARNNNLFKLVVLINDSVEVNQVNSHGITPLIQAANSGSGARLKYCSSWC